MNTQQKTRKKRKRRFAAIEFDDCSGCGACVDVCPVGCLRLTSSFEEGYFVKMVVIEPDRCIGCRFCEQICIKQAISVVERDSGEVTEGVG